MGLFLPSSKITAAIDRDVRRFKEPPMDLALGEVNITVQLDNLHHFNFL